MTKQTILKKFKYVLKSIKGSDLKEMEDYIEDWYLNIKDNE